MTTYINFYGCPVQHREGWEQRNCSLGDETPQILIAVSEEKVTLTTCQYDDYLDTLVFIQVLIHYTIHIICHNNNVSVQFGCINIFAKWNRAMLADCLINSLHICLMWWPCFKNHVYFISYMWIFFLLKIAVLESDRELHWY